ncbi:MAG: flagellar hook-associated protein 3 [Pseudobutyrivibrio ruminis]|nr:flagellar hook-associated protein 3 [Pseudobutyrivibrio ruminis]
MHMRVTNKMIMNNAASNINSTKEIVNKRNTQMTSQKKIDKPSDDPVIAVRSLRLSTTLAQVTQYYDKNIPDATQWISVTETALINIRDIGKDCKEIAVAGSTDTVNQDDRKTMITQLEALQKQLYAEGNSDYANRTVFTGYRTNCNLTFTEDDPNTKYQINQSLSIEDLMEEHRYYSGEVIIPTTEEELLKPSLDPTVAISDITQTNFYRLRMNYNEIDTVNSVTFTLKGGTELNPSPTVTVYEDQAAWADANAGVKTVADDAAVFIRKTGELIFGNTLAASLKEGNATVDIQYEKQGFSEGELRPEYYYNCTKLVDETRANLTSNNVYTKFDDEGNRIYFDIEYTIAANQTININTEACDVFDSSVQRDVGEMIDAVQRVVKAYDKLSTLDDMMRETQYASDTDQEWLQKWKDAAQKEYDYYNDNMQKLFNTEIGKLTEYYDTITLAITDLGCKGQSLELTKTRVGDQKETVQELQSNNDDIDLSQIIIQYTAAYTAYQSSLTAAGKLGDSTLLNYI